ncbi:MAG TPA: serine hydrolase domain-containing protein [Vicinamibacterales bacterium]|nr:serine hydrolase domain-containing protein [Vicinamibacterales bacterium]
MKRSLFLVPVLLLLVTLRAAPPPALTSSGTTALSQFFSDAVARGDVPGVVAIVVDRDQAVYHEAFGKMNAAQNVPMSKDTIFRIASMTKAVTSVGVMQLVEEGKLGLDDEVSKYIPSLKSPHVFSKVDEKAGTYETRPATRAITIRQLLTHTSGIGYSWSDHGLAIAQKKTGATNDSELPLVNEPGAQWTYGASTRVLGAVIEKISGQRVDAYLEAHVTGPLGMHDTTYTVPQAKYARVVTLHQKANGKITETQNPDPIPATIRGDGGLFSTAADYSRFVQMILNRGQLGGTRILKESTVAEMSKNQTGSVKVRPQPTADPLRSKPYPLGAGEDVWGLGFQIAAPKSPTPSMRSPGSMSWAGINNTFYWIDPQKQVGAVILMQLLPFYDEKALGVLQGFEERVYRNLK